MKLPFMEKKEIIQYFLALVLRQEKISAVIFEETNGKISVVGKHDQDFPTNIEDATQEELLEIIDQAISQAESTLPENVETHKTVFGVRETWVTDGKIKKEYLAKLKKISDELSLEPLGFLTISEAISHLLQKEEGAPVTAILTEIGRKSVTISHVKAGKILETKNANITGSIAQTVDTLLKHLTASDILPSRIIVFDGSEDYSQEFITHQWSKTLPFLHLPQITQLTSGFDAKAVLSGAATQMGFEIIADIKMPESKIEHISELPPLAPKKEKEPEILDADEKIQPEPDADATQDAESAPQYFGFAQDLDIAKVKKTEPIKAQEEEILVDPIKEIPNEMEREEEMQPLPVQGMMMEESGKKIFNKFGSMVKIIKLPKLPFPKLKAGGNKKILFVPVFIMLLIIFFVFYFFMRKATVILTINPKNVSKDSSVTFATDQSTSFADKIIAADFSNIDEDGSVTTPATGKKDTGDPAKGMVTIFNNNDSSKTLPKGTVLTSANGLTFVTASDVTVASASGDVFSGTQPGTVTVNVTASTFGTESNLPSGTKFSINSSSSVAAKNDNAFSGGTKKQITVISKDDIAKLLDTLPKNLEQKAKDDFQKQIGSDKQGLSSFASETVSKKDFDKNAGDAASQVTLNGTVTFEGIMYKKSDIQDFAKNVLSSSLASDTTMNPDATTITVKDISVKNPKEVNANVSVTTQLLPDIQTANLEKSLAGKSYADAQKTLEALPQVSNVTISGGLSLPFLQILPFVSSHITVAEKNE